ncbi:MAG: carboxylesterase/lipase family protein [Pseudomonadota bacterium]|jgi:para-nitrobenzyl esterase
MRAALSPVLALLLALCAVPGAQAQPRTGPWFDRTRDGHGLDVQRYGDALGVIFYTFDAAGEPEWFLAQGVPAGDTLDAPLLRFRNAGTPERPDAQPRTAGSLRLRFGTAGGAPPCAAGESRPGAARLADFEATIDGERIRWCVEPLLPEPVTPVSAMDGTWWGGAADAGWGLTTYFVDLPGARAAVALLYAYDAAGEPRWNLAQAGFDAFRVEARLASYRGYCRTCPGAPRQLRDAGSVSLSLVAPLPEATGNRIDLDARHPGPAGGVWRRMGPLVRISDAIAPPRTAVTREGIVAGAADAAATTAWRGVPFAAAPVGALRWRAPQPPPARDRVLAATRFGPACPQSPGQGFFASAPTVQDEDCLTLNVWSPDAAQAGDRRPVMVWIHGGGHVQGGSAEELNGLPIYDGSRFARRGVVLVSVNYRLGALGYAAIRDFIGEHPDQPAAGNYGLLDQVAALRWVRDNIARFGGDPSRVTIFGESAGAVSVCALLATPLARGLFARAITQSGPCDATSRLLLTGAGTIEPAVAQGERIKQRLGCTATGAEGRTCLRGKAVADILAAAEGSIGFAGTGEGYDEIVDGFALSRSPGTALADGSAAPVPLMVGVNEDEATTLVPVAQRPTTVAAYEALVRARAAPIADLVLAQYPASAYQPLWRAWTAINTDVAFICPAARVARDHAARGNPVYAYYFTQSLPTSPELGAFHAIEIPFLFTDLAGQPPSLRALGDALQRLWVDFATDGVPDAAGVPAWPRHPAAAQLGLEFNAAAIALRVGYRDEHCGFWARFVRL